MKIELVLPNIEDAVFWLKVRSQSSTQNNNPVGILSLDELKKKISESNQPISKKQNVHRYFIKFDNKYVG